MTGSGAANVEPEVQQAVEATAALLEEMGHTMIEIPTHTISMNTIKSLLPDRNTAPTRSKNEARALGRQIDSSTLEPLSLKLYEFGRNAQSASLGDMFEAWPLRDSAWVRRSIPSIFC